jgi:hypothetical protein
VRARRVQGKARDTVVKLRPADPAQLAPKLRRSRGLRSRARRDARAHVSSASLKAKVDPTVIRHTIKRHAPLRKLFSKEQRKFYDARASESLGLDDPTTLGPVFVLKLTFKPEDFTRRLVAELWLYPDDSRILELSTNAARPGLPGHRGAARVPDPARRGPVWRARNRHKRALEFVAARLRQTVAPGPPPERIPRCVRACVTGSAS